jgi:predicted negative regulator of RcsB-dependent stress response
VGTTKLTRKEILGEDPVYEALVTSVEKVRDNSRWIGIGILGAAVLGLALYFGLQLLDRREMEAQRQLAKATDFYHGAIDATALDDPYGRGPDPTFRTEEAKYRAAATEFRSVVERYGSSKLGIIARYYEGLCHVQLGQRAEAVKALEAVRDNNKDRTLSYLAKKVLAKCYLDMNNPKGAQDLLEGMIKDPQCELPKEELKLQLSKVYMVQGKRDDALRVLREARTEAGRSSLQTLIGQELSRIETAGGGGTPTQLINTGLPVPASVPK